MKNLSRLIHVWFFNQKKKLIVEMVEKELGRM